MCACSRCRKRTGSVLAANLFVPVEQLVWSHGEDQLRRFELPTAEYFSTGFCATCGGALPWLTRSGTTWVVPAGALDGDPGRGPERIVHWASRAPWHPDELDALPKLAEGR